jgi:putative nucleotidyltransferase with HDIG domain
MRQYWSGATAVYSKADEAFARSYLNIQEMALFNQLPGFEKKHCVVVTKIMLEMIRGAPELEPRKIARLGLLHDIGKIRERNSLLTKSILVIVRFLTPWLYDWLADRGENHPLLRRFYIHKHHGAVGAELLAKLGEESEIIAIVKKHDPRLNPWGPEDPLELKLLQAADSSY